MKKLLIIIMLGLALPSVAQPPVKLYAYSQEFTPGMIRARDENGNQPSPQVNITYYIYVRVPATARIKPLKVWVNGKQAQFSFVKTDSTPVYNDQPTVTGQKAHTLMVPKTSLPVYQVQIQSLDAIPDPGAPKQAQQYELLFRYTWHGKIYTATVKKIRVLDAVMGV